jgi:cytoskeletal protein RodZ
VPSVLPENVKDDHPESHEVPPTSSSRICGLATRTFWILLVLLFVVLGAAIGGGVAGGLSAAHKDKSVSDPSQQQSTGVASSSSSSSSSSSTTSTSSSTSTSTGIPPSSTEPGIYRIVNIYANTAIDLYVLEEKFLSILQNSRSFLVEMSKFLK